MLPTLCAPTGVAPHIQALHQLYSQLTGQMLPLRYHRERMWWELLRAGYTPQEVRLVIRYLQREIRAGRRNVGALKLSNLLQLDRFEEDLHISHVRLRPELPPPTPDIPRAPTCPPQEQERRRQYALARLHELRERLRRRQS